MANNIGRNEQCPCGSGKKYKICHLLMGGFPHGVPKVSKIEPTAKTEGIRRKLERQQLERRTKLAHHGIFIDFVTPIQFKGNKAWALGSRLYPYQRSEETFHEFIVHVLKLELGKEWWDEQRVKPEKDQHFIFTCFKKHYEWQERNQTSENKFGDVWRAVPDGYTRALISLAFDVCSLLNAVYVPKIFLDKLKSYPEYQGVRYEVAISAMFARMGYQITFLDEELSGQKSQPKHSEFVAVNPKTKEEIVIECKSKTRKGALHRAGVFVEEREFRSSVTKLYRNALKQKPIDKPFIVFIDMNLPQSKDTPPDENMWIRAITKMRDAATFGKQDEITPVNAVVFTNYSYHYGTDKETGSGEWLLEKSGRPEFPIKSSDFGDRFISALQNYGNVPNIDYEVQS